MVAELLPERDFRGPGCDERCQVLKALIPGVFGRSDILLHDPQSHEAYGRSLCTHVSRQEPNIVVTGPLVIDLRKLEVTLGGRYLHLTPIELKLLRALGRRVGAATDAIDLLVEVWGENYLVGNREQTLNLLRTFVWRVRRKLRAAGSLIAVVPSIGYRLDMIPAGSEAPPLEHHRPCGFQPIYAWSKQFDRCQGCGTDERPHEGKGFCRRCYYRHKTYGEVNPPVRSDGAP